MSSLGHEVGRTGRCLSKDTALQRFDQRQAGRGRLTHVAVRIQDGTEEL